MVALPFMSKVICINIYGDLHMDALHIYGSLK